MRLTWSLISSGKVRKKCRKCLSITLEGSPTNTHTHTHTHTSFYNPLKHFHPLCFFFSPSFLHVDPFYLTWSCSPVFNLLSLTLQSLSGQTMRINTSWKLPWRSFKCLEVNGKVRFLLYFIIFLKFCFNLVPMCGKWCKVVLFYPDCLVGLVVLLLRLDVIIFLNLSSCLCIIFPTE